VIIELKQKKYINKMNSINIYLATCDKTLHILDATIFLYKKFINTMIPHFKILGFTKPTLKDWENVEFISLSNERQDISLWSVYLCKYFKTVNEKNIFFALDDFFPIDYFNKKTYDFAINYMNENPVGFCIVGQEPSGDPARGEVEKIIVENEDMFIYQRKKNVNYQLVLQPGIWNREYLCLMFNNPSTPWSFELQTTNIANNNNDFYNISCSKNISYEKCIMCYSTQSSLSSKWDGISVLGLKHEFILELIEKNMLSSSKLLIGAWNNYILFDKNKECDKNNLIKLCHNEYKWWKECYERFYK
tara:strand:- start:7650 stop:8561 length:912 start_codon:yes stop_codon:yes gene_type:complete